MNFKAIFIPVLALSLTFGFSSCKKDRWPCIKADKETTTETRTVSSWNEVELNLAADVFIAQDPNLSEHTVRIEAPNNLMEHINTEVNGNRLELYTKRCFRGDENIRIYLKVRDIDEVDLAGSGTIESQNTIETNELSLKISGSGNINFDADVNNLTTRISGSGKIDTEGETNRHDAKISGSGDLLCYGMDCNTATVKITGSGDAWMQVADELDVTISGSGDVWYLGNPSVNTNISGSGDVHSDN